MSNMSDDALKRSIRNVPDFPVAGIQFKDVTTLFKDPACLLFLSDKLYEFYKNKGLTKIVGVESRGFIMGPVLAARLGIGFVPIRKPGKLPADVFEESYGKEYGTDSIQIHQDALCESDVVLIHDDLLATGGTMIAACKLVERFSPKKIFVNAIVELESLKARNLFSKDLEVYTVIKFDI
ncbi:adenine phosphoribosyltransferase [Bacteroidales bacterium]|nr:adenine phosphoribosyltransferase [Bacteroidales bacterium]